MEQQCGVQHPDVHMGGLVPRPLVGWNHLLCTECGRIRAGYQPHQFLPAARHHLDRLCWHHLQNQTFREQGKFCDLLGCITQNFVFTLFLVVTAFILFAFA